MSISYPAPPLTPAVEADANHHQSQLWSIGGVPVYVYAVSLSSLLVVVGIIWDISWHMSIGRDKLLSPPHLLVYLGAIFGGLFSGIQVLWNTFKGTDATKAGLVRVWGFFYSSLGALFCIWGAIAMLTSAPFDDWWHNTYGLDVTILSPPHTVLGLGMLFLQFGACVGVAKYYNQAIEGSSQAKRLYLLYLVAASSLVTMVCIVLSEFLDTRNQRTGVFYILSAATVLLLLAALGRPLRRRWSMTEVALGYFLIATLTNWVLQIFKAEPLLGPIQNHVTHFQPLAFPMLLFIPALAMDALMHRLSGANDWIKSAAISVVFILVLFAIQYPFSGFLLESPSARNWFFGSHSWYYGAPPDWEYRYQFAPWERQSWRSLFVQLLIAMALGAIITGRLGLRWGKWLGAVKR